MINAFTKKTGVLLADRTVPVSSSADIQDAIDSLPPVLAADATLVLDGDSRDPCVYSLGGTINVYKLVQAGKALKIKGEDGAHTGILTATGGGANTIKVAQAELPRPEGDEWIDCKLQIVSVGQNAQNGTEAPNIQDYMEVQSIASSGSDWEITLKSGWSNTLAGIGDFSQVKFVICACVLEYNGTALDVIASGDGEFVLDDIMVKGQVDVQRRGILRLEQTTLTKSPGYGIDVNRGTLIFDEGHSPAILAATTYGVFIGNGAFISAADGDNFYISGNEKDGLYAPSWFPNSTFVIYDPVLDHNNQGAGGDFAADIYASHGFIKDALIYGAATAKQLRSNLLATINTNNNGGDHNPGTTVHNTTQNDEVCDHDGWFE